MAVKPGERKLRILQSLAGMLEDPRGEKITTAGLAARLECSEAALYRHFASKAQMFEGLIEFIDSSLFGVINQISDEESDGLCQTESIVAMLLRFAERNRGMTRVLIGDVLVNENERLLGHIKQIIDRLETTLKQTLRVAATQHRVAAETDVGAAANLIVSYVVGRWHAYVRSGFSRLPTAQWEQQWPMLLTACVSRPATA